MPDLDQMKQGEQGARDRRGRFARGRSGNPAGRPRGCRDHVNHAARLLLAGEGEALTRKAVAAALAGDPRNLQPTGRPSRPATSADDYWRIPLLAFFSRKATSKTGTCPLLRWMNEIKSA